MPETNAGAYFKARADRKVRMAKLCIDRWDATNVSLHVMSGASTEIEDKFDPTVPQAGNV